MAAIFKLKPLKWERLHFTRFTFIYELSFFGLKFFIRHNANNDPLFGWSWDSEAHFGKGTGKGTGSTLKAVKAQVRKYILNQLSPDIEKSNIEK